MNENNAISVKIGSLVNETVFIYNGMTYKLINDNPNTEDLKAIDVEHWTGIYSNGRIYPNGEKCVIASPYLSGILQPKRNTVFNSEDFVTVSI